MFSWIWRLLMGDHREPNHVGLDQRERQVVATIARVSGRTEEDVRREQRRRALAIEVSSYRRPR
jgi:hypothetical protein